MDRLIDFSGARRVFRTFGGSDQKLAVVLEGKVYMLKFAQFHAKHTDMSTSYVNSVLSEYVCSHIAETVSLPVHKTILGMYNKPGTVADDEKVLVVACEDFRTEGDTNAEFSEFLRAEFRTDEINRVVRLDQIYTVLRDRNYFPEELERASIERYWDTFVIDALVGNFDRHPGNWGYLFNRDVLRLAPVYDFGSCLLPQLADEGIEEIWNNDYEMLRRCYVYPSPALYITAEKTGKVGYYDMLASGYDEECTKALLRVVPRIDEKAIDSVIDNTPLLTDIRRDFYKRYIHLRKHMIVDRAYQLAKEGRFDNEAMDRVKNGTQYSEGLLKQKIAMNEVRAEY